VNLVNRELKFFFTSPLFIGLELAPAALIGVIILSPAIYNFSNLLSVAWIIIVLYSTYFELETWRREFLNKGVKLRLYVNKSEYTPFLAHSLVSLILLELKTLIVLTSIVLMSPIREPVNFNDMAFFLLITHGNWLFSLSVGHIFSKEVFKGLAASTAVFLSMLIFNAVTILVVYQTFISQSSVSYWPAASLDLSKGTGFSTSPYVLIALFLSLLLYVSALYAGSLAAKNIRIDDI